MYALTVEQMSVVTGGVVKPIDVLNGAFVGAEGAVGEQLGEVIGGAIGSLGGPLGAVLGAAAGAAFAVWLIGKDGN